MDSDYPRGTCENVVYHFHGTILTIITSYLRPVYYKGEMLLNNIVSLIILRVEKQKLPFGPTELDHEAGKIFSHENVKMFPTQVRKV